MVILEYQHSSHNLLTPPRPSEISEKNWSRKAKPFFDITFMIRSHVESMNQLTSKANSAIIWGIGISKMASPMCPNFSHLFLTV